jgi:hypothetical protein
MMSMWHQIFNYDIFLVNTAVQYCLCFLSDIVAKAYFYCKGNYAGYSSICTVLFPINIELIIHAPGIRTNILFY